jgi:hypothetical protein
MYQYVLDDQGRVVAMSRSPVNEADVLSRGGSIVNSEVLIEDLLTIESFVDRTPVLKATLPIRLADLKATALVDLMNDYQAAATQAVVAHTSQAGVTQLYQADQTKSAKSVSNQLLAYQDTQATPPGFYWVAQDNTRVPFTYADLQGLAAAIGAATFNAFDKLQDLKAALREASNAAEVAAIKW